MPPGLTTSQPKHQQPSSHQPSLLPPLSQTYRPSPPQQQQQQQQQPPTFPKPPPPHYHHHHNNNNNPNNKMTMTTTTLQYTTPPTPPTFPTNVYGATNKDAPITNTPKSIMTSIPLYGNNNNNNTLVGSNALEVRGGCGYNGVGMSMVNGGGVSSSLMNGGGGVGYNTNNGGGGISYNIGGQQGRGGGGGYGNSSGMIYDVGGVRRVGKIGGGRGKRGSGGSSVKRMHLCGYCCKGFTKQSNRRIHERIHTGTYPYICRNDVCGKRFMWRSSINFHEKNCMGRVGLDLIGTPFKEEDERNKTSRIGRGRNINSGGGSAGFAGALVTLQQHASERDVMVNTAEVLRGMGAVGGQEGGLVMGAAGGQNGSGHGGGGLYTGVSQGYPLPRRGIGSLPMPVISSHPPVSVAQSSWIPTSSAPVGVPEVALPGDDIAHQCGGLFSQ